MPKFILTGFSKFQGVDSNPTEGLISDLTGLLQQGSLKLHGDSEVASCTVLQVAIRGLDAWFNTIFNNLPAVLQPNEDVILLHLGVDSRCTVPKLEARAVNNATFRCPDEAGAQPQRQMIDSSADRSLGDLLYTDLPVQPLAEALKAHGLDVEVSLDAGLFLCNLIYFSCLLRCQREGSGRWHALFVHVPPFQAYARDRQLHLLITLLNLLAIMYSTPPAAAPAPEATPEPSQGPQEFEAPPASSAPSRASEPPKATGPACTRNQAEPKTSDVPLSRQRTVSPAPRSAEAAERPKVSVSAVEQQA